MSMQSNATNQTNKARLVKDILTRRARHKASAEATQSEVRYTELNTFPVSPHTIARIMFSLAIIPTLYTIFATYFLPWRPDNHKLISGSIFLLWFIAVVLGAIVGMYWDNQNADKAIKRRGDYVTELTTDGNEFESLATLSYTEAEAYTEELRQAEATEGNVTSESSDATPPVDRNPYL